MASMTATAARLIFPRKNAAARIKQRSPVTHFNDLLSGEIHADERLAREDFIIHRRDGLFRL